MEITQHTRASANLLDQAVSLITEEMALMGLTPTAELDPDLPGLSSFYTEHGELWLAHDAGILLGTCAVRRCDDGTGELRRFYVVPSYRKQGVGSALIMEAMRFCQSQRLTKLCAHTQKDNEALAYYARLGFTEVPLPPNVAERDGTICLSVDLGS